ncbi:MAG: malto-oligosyltrehalose synthase [Bryobacteraceae bacterium]|nr:malto-oligosyltrehalose synthase [Bryobacteraceae bacterium]
MRIPTATYRVQMNKDFGFQAARRALPYLTGLGISDLYMSPILKARPGSTHGYDVVDPTALNLELGSEEDFRALVEDLKQRGMGLLLDIVPNHMAASSDNPWWRDVLENGASSWYAGYFDIHWERNPGQASEEQIFLPILGAPYGTVLENQELRLALEPDGFFVHYYAAKLPVGPTFYDDILKYRFDGAHQGLAALIEQIERLPERTVTDWAALEARQHDKERIKRELWLLYSSDPGVKEFIDENIRIFNGEKGAPSSFDLLDHILAGQPYRLSFWRVARERINYRRFFDVTDLIGLRAEEPGVFESTHAFILELMAKGLITGLRIDHIDGLYDPLAYLTQLRSRITDEEAYIVVEKILTGNERLPEQWPVAGTTGYDFLGFSNSLFVEPAGFAEFQRIYARFTGIRDKFEDVVYQKQKFVMDELFPGDMLALGAHLALLAEHDRHARDLSPRELSAALLATTACFPVYRTYTRDFNVSPEDRACIEQAVATARTRNPEITPAVFDFVRRVLLLEFPEWLPEDQPGNWLAFVMRWQQLTSPITAKGIEDTTLYMYNPLVSLNEVGGLHHPVSPEEFHGFNRRRHERWPLSMNTTSTHDTKRSEDVRARINVLSESPWEWARSSYRWSRFNEGKKLVPPGQPRIDANEEILIYQTLVGGWPLCDEDIPAFRERMKQYILKAMREAKVYSSWIEPNVPHEEAVLSFLQGILEPDPGNRFLPDFLKFQSEIAWYGALNSLAQLLLKITSPGVPDFYQGAGLWDLSLVDPDNRRPTDYERRTAMIADIEARSQGDLAKFAAELLKDWKSGAIKLYLSYQGLQLRRRLPAVFNNGDYLPLDVLGRRRDHIVSYARSHNGAWVVTVVPRLLTEFTTSFKPPVGFRIWRDTAIEIPAGGPRHWRNVFTNEDLTSSPCGEGALLKLEHVFSILPFAILESR